MLLLILLHQCLALPGEFLTGITFLVQQYLENKITIVFYILFKLNNLHTVYLELLIIALTFSSIVTIFTFPCIKKHIIISGAIKVFMIFRR